MRTDSSSIPVVTADFVMAKGTFIDLAHAPLRETCALIQIIADSGKSVDDLTVRELVEMSRKAGVGNDAAMARAKAPSGAFRAFHGPGAMKGGAADGEKVVPWHARPVRR